MFQQHVRYIIYKLASLRTDGKLHCTSGRNIMQRSSLSAMKIFMRTKYKAMLRYWSSSAERTSESLFKRVKKDQFSVELNET